MLHTSAKMEANFPSETAAAGIKNKQKPKPNEEGTRSGRSGFSTDVERTVKIKAEVRNTKTCLGPKP